MYKITLFITLIFMFGSAFGRSNAPARIVIDKSTTNRTICGVRFGSIDGLRVVATRVTEQVRWRSRVNIERYSTCPYEVRAYYRNRSFRLGFSISVTQDEVENVSPGEELDLIFFKFDGEKWVAHDPLVPNPINKITVLPGKNQTMVTGLVERVIEPGGSARFCFGAVLIRSDGFVISVSCAPSLDVVKPLAELFERNAPVISAD